MEFFVRLITEFASLTIQVIPFFLFGVLFAAILATYVKADFILGHLNRGLGSIINAACLGLILPGCACTTVPMARGLKSKGADLGTVAAFLFASPLLSPQTLMLTYGMLGWKFALGRIVLALTGALSIGFLFRQLAQKKIDGFSLANGKDAEECTDSCCACGGEAKNNFLKNFFEITMELGRYFLLGLFIASLLTVLIPPDMIPKYVGSSGPFAYLIAVFLGIPVYVCEGEEIPLTAALLKLGLGQGPAMSFLLGSVGTCIPTMIMAAKMIGKKPMLLYIVFWFVFAFTAGLLFSAF
jgi:uncharacterized membrane protein YraQ (UPF0718 family)